MNNGSNQRLPISAPTKKKPKSYGRPILVIAGILALSGLAGSAQHQLRKLAHDWLDGTDATTPNQASAPGLTPDMMRQAHNLPDIPARGGTARPGQNLTPEEMRRDYEAASPEKRASMATPAQMALIEAGVKNIQEFSNRQWTTYVTLKRHLQDHPNDGQTIWWSLNPYMTYKQGVGVSDTLHDFAAQNHLLSGRFDGGAANFARCTLQNRDFDRYLDDCYRAVRETTTQMNNEILAVPDKERKYQLLAAFGELGKLINQRDDIALRGASHLGSLVKFPDQDLIVPEHGLAPFTTQLPPLPLHGSLTMPDGKVQLAAYARPVDPRVSSFGL